MRLLIVMRPRWVMVVVDVRQWKVGLLESDCHQQDYWFAVRWYHRQLQIRHLHHRIARWEFALSIEVS